MIAFLLLFAVAFVEGQELPSIDYTQCDMQLMQNTNIKYLIAGPYGHKTVKDLNQCLTTGGHPVQLFPCNDETLIFTKCGDKTVHYQTQPSADFGETWVEELESFVAYGVEQSSECSIDNPASCTTEYSARMHIFESKCYYEEEGLYSKFLVEGNKVVWRYYSDVECTQKHDSEEDNSDYDLECDGVYELQSINNVVPVKIFCSSTIQPPSGGNTGGEGSTVTCEPTLANKKYIVKTNQDGTSRYFETGKCVTFYGQNFVITPCTNDKVTVKPCDDPTAEGQQMDLITFGTEYSDTIPEGAQNAGGNTGGEGNDQGGEGSTVTCDPALANKKYIVKTKEDGTSSYFEIGKCVTFYGQNFVITPCTNDKVTTKPCDDPTAAGQQINLSMFGEYSDTIPEGAQNAGGNGQGENTEPSITCTANYGKDFKYFIMGEGYFVALTLNECVDGEKYVPCTDKYVKVVSCDANQENEFDEFVEIDNKMTKYSKDLPAHIAHAIHYSDDKCTTEVKGRMTLFTNGCVKVGDEDEVYYMKAIMDGNRMIIRSYTDAECKTKVDGSEGEMEQKCGECDAGEESKLICSEYVKEDGAFVTFLLMAIALIFFLF